jgi:hypothetical protein
MFLYSLISAHISCYYSNNKCEEVLPYPVKKYLNRKISYFFSFIPKKHYTFALAIETIHLFKLQNGNHHWRDGRVVDYNGLENRRAERHRGFESLSLRFRYSEMNIREKSKKIVSIIATSSYDTFLLYPSQISEYARRGQKLPKCSKKATIRLHIFKAK